MDRLLRLQHAHGEMVKALEEKLGRAEQGIVALARARSEVDQLAAKLGDTMPASLPSILRSLSAMDGQLTRRQAEIDAIRRDLIAATSRQEMISSRVDELSAVRRRKLLEAEMLEAAWTGHAKASGKGGVMN